MAAEALQWTFVPKTPVQAHDRPGAEPAGSAAAPLLALFGLPPTVAEPVMLLASILGWRVETRECGVAPPADLCLAMLPAAAAERPPIVAWSPDRNLNEHISGASLSILEHPVRIARLEALLQKVSRV